MKGRLPKKLRKARSRPRLPHKEMMMVLFLLFTVLLTAVTGQPWVLLWLGAIVLAAALRVTA